MQYRKSSKILPQMPVINAMNVDLLKLKLDTHTNLTNVSKDKEGCIQKGHKFNKVRL